MIGLVVQAQRIGRCQRGGAARGIQRLVEPAQRAIHLADVAQIERRIDAVPERTLHQIERLRDIALTERDDAGEMQRIALVRRSVEDVVEQPLRVVQPAATFVFVGDAQHLADRQRHGARRWRPWRGRGRLHQSTV